MLAAEIFNECLDMWFGEEAQIQPWQIQGAWHDILNTMLLPTALFLLCRYKVGLFVRDLEDSPTGTEGDDQPS